MKNIGNLIKCAVNPVANVRKYLQEWRDEVAYANKYTLNPDSDPNFSWSLHDKELISIQRAIRHTYSKCSAMKRFFLTKKERAEIENILNCIID